MHFVGYLCRYCQQLQLRKKLRLGTWNIRSILHLGKVQLAYIDYSVKRWYDCELILNIGIYMWVVRVEIRWTRAFHNTGWPHNSILRSGHVRTWQAGFIGKSLWDMNRSATESFISSSLLLFFNKKLELSPSDRAMRLVSSNLAN